MRRFFAVLALVLLAFSAVYVLRPTVGERSARTARSSRHPIQFVSVSRSKLTPECQKSVDAGMRWLLVAMRNKGGVGPDIGEPPDLGSTAIVGLALLAEGNTRTGGP